MTIHRTLDEIEGVEYFWLATDAEGKVAMFSTAGGGYAPDAFLKNIDAHDKAIEKIRQLPELAPPHKAPAPNDGDNIWRELAERGMFTFDSDAFGGPYNLESAPTNPVDVSTLPTDVGHVARSIHYPNITFRSVESIDKSLLVSPAVMALPQRAGEPDRG